MGFCLSFEKFADARFLTSRKNSAVSRTSCKPDGTGLISPRLCKLSYTHEERYISHEDNLTEVEHLAP